MTGARCCGRVLAEWAPFVCWGRLQVSGHPAIHRPPLPTPCQCQQCGQCLCCPSESSHRLHAEGPGVAGRWGSSDHGLPDMHALPALRSEKRPGLVGAGTLAFLASTPIPSALRPLALKTLPSLAQLACLISVLSSLADSPSKLPSPTLAVSVDLPSLTWEVSTCPSLSLSIPATP